MSGVVGAYFKVLTDDYHIDLFFVTWILLPVVYLLLTKKESTLSEVKLAKSSTKLKAKIGWPILLKTAIEFCFVPFNYFNNLDFTPIRNRIFTRDGRRKYCFRL
jgi:large-conductance mechanosensitive channel